MLDLAAAKPPLFAPGTSFSYSNTDYTLLGLILERITGRSWRHEVTRRVIRPLRLSRTALPPPGQRSIKGPLAHGYVELDGQLVDVNIDPSFAGAAGGYALATTVGDLARFLDTLLAGRLFRHRATLKEMLTIAPAQGEGGLVGYGLGIEQRALPGGPTLIGHLGGAVYRSYVGRLHPTNVDDRARAQRRGRPDAAAPPGGQGAPSDASVNHDERREALVSRRARPPTDVAPRRTRRPTRTLASMHPSSALAFSRVELGLPGLGRQGCGAIAARSSAWRPRGSGRASDSAVLRQRAAHLVEHPLPAAAAACRPRRATRPRRGACRCKPETARRAAPTAVAPVGPGLVGRAGPLATPETGCLTPVRRPGRDGPQPACRASPRARPACAPATARRPVLRVPRPSLRARRGRPRRG